MICGDVGRAVNSNRDVAGTSEDDGKPRGRRDLNIHYYLPTTDTDLSKVYPDR